jgi:hypothetical protein
MRNAIMLLAILSVTLLAVLGCDRGQDRVLPSETSASAGNHGESQPSENGVGPEPERPDAGGTAAHTAGEEIIQGMPFEEKLYHNWDFDISLYPKPSDGDYDLGTIIQRGGEWSAFFDGEYAVMYLEEVHVQKNAAIFELERWGRSPDDPVGYVPPPEDRSQYRVTLTEQELDRVVLRGLAATVPRPGIVVTARRLGE